MEYPILWLVIDIRLVLSGIDEGSLKKKYHFKGYIFGWE